MAVRPIDGNKLIEWFSPYLHTGEPIPADVVIEDIRSMPTLTPVFQTGTARQTNADRIRAMSDQELAAFLDRISIGGDEPWESIFKTTFCDCCPTVEITEEDGTQHYLNECDFVDGVCPHGNSIQWWLKQPAEKK